MQHLLSLFFLLLLTSTPSLQAATPPPNASSRKLIFLLAGQSNMSGRGGVFRNHWDGIVPAPDCLPSPSVLRLSASLQWEEAREPLHSDIDTAQACGVGPGMAFGNAVGAAEAGQVIGLVPCAVGGTRIAEWERGTALYEGLVRRAKAAVAQGGGAVAALLWYQGEADTVLRADAEAYGRRMVMMVRDLRADLGLPHLLVIQVAIASGAGNFIDTVREAQKGIKLRNVRCVDAKGLELEAGGLHLSSKAQVQLGKMLAQSYLNHGTTSC